jgi:hypothetical protein
MDVMMTEALSLIMAMVLELMSMSCAWPASSRAKAALSSFALRFKVSVNFVMSETVIKKLCTNTLAIYSGRLLASLARNCGKRSFAVTSATQLSFVNFLDTLPSMIVRLSDRRHWRALRNETLVASGECEQLLWLIDYG